MKKLFVLLCFPVCVFSQMSKQDSIWMPFQKFVGNWSGTGVGEPGTGKYERSYSPFFGKTFVEVKNKSTYEPTEKNPKGEVHQDIGYISYDKAAKTFVLRQFHTEGFVNTYKLESISPDKKTIVFVTESIENIPAGYKAREIYVFTSDNEFTETFEIAPPNGTFSLYSKAVFRK